MSAFWGWLFNTPVWIQTPLVVVFLVVLSGALAFVVMKVMAVVIPPSAQEREMTTRDDQSEEPDEHD